MYNASIDKLLNNVSIQYILQFYIRVCLKYRFFIRYKTHPTNKKLMSIHLKYKINNLKLNIKSIYFVQQINLKSQDSLLLRHRESSNNAGLIEISILFFNTY